MFCASQAMAQELEITPFAGYMWGGNLRVYTGELRAGDGPNYGLALNYSLTPGTQLEGFWFIQSAKMKFIEYGLYENETSVFDLNTNYIHVGILREMNDGQVVRPFGTFSMGTTIFNSKDSFYSSIWRFSVGLGAGAKFYFSDRFGFRLQGRLLLPIYFSGAGVWCGTSGNCNYGISSATIIAQGDISAGFIIVIR